MDVDDDKQDVDNAEEDDVEEEKKEEEEEEDELTEYELLQLYRRESAAVDLNWHHASGRRRGEYFGQE